MANRSAITISTSRFAVLKVEDSGDAKKQSSKDTEKPAQQNSRQSSAKKKNKKRKEQNDKETEQLKSLAFGKGGSSSGGGGGGAKHQASRNQDAGADSRKWNKWREHDSAAVEEQFKDDLAQAILQSKLENEKKKQEAEVLKARIDAGLEEPKTKNEKKKRKQKEKPQPMSLEQFKQLPPERPPGSDSEDEETTKPKAPILHTRVPATEKDPAFFNSVQDDAAQILRQEKMQEEYRKQYASESVISAKLKSALEEKDNQIQELRLQLEKMEGEFKQVKKRNKQLCVILAQGEMKDKAQVLIQVDELTVVKDELTEQVTSLTAELEKEKSKNHALKAENDKLKASKHGK